MVRVLRLAFLCGLIFPAFAVAAEETRVHRYVLISDGENVGHLAVTVRGEKHEVDWHVDNNGRGERLREQLRVSPEGVPIQQSVQGTTLAGALVADRYEFRSGVARWKTHNDSGEAKSALAPVYVAADPTPWSLALAARVAMRRTEGRLPILPKGEMRAERLGDMQVGAGASVRQLGVYAVWGLAMAPQLLLLDEQGLLFAEVDGRRTLLAQGYEDQLEAVRARTDQLEAAYIERLSGTLRHRFDEPVYIRNVHVFDSVRAVRSGLVTVSLYRGRIGSISETTPPPNSVVVDGEGGTLVPGLHDMHVHLDSPWRALYHLAAGVTTVRDQGNDNLALRSLIDRVEAGRALGPRVDPSGMLEGRTAYSARSGFVVDSLPLAIEKVRWYADRGYRRIKIYNSFNADWVAPVATEAHALGMSVVGHVPAFASAEQMVLAGYDEITHLNQLMLMFVLRPGEDTRTVLRVTAIGERLGGVDLASAPVQRLLQLMRERHVGLDTTSAIFEYFMTSRPGLVAGSDVGWLAHAPGPMQRARMKPMFNIQPSHYANWNAAWDKMLGIIKMFHDAGIRLLPGTDDVDGFMYHSELEAYVRAGIPAARVLQIATLECARQLGNSERLGSIEPGKLADLVLVPGDPVQDISTMRNARLVVKNGELLFPEEIYAALGVQPFGRTPPLR